MSDENLWGALNTKTQKIEFSDYDIDEVRKFAADNNKAFEANIYKVVPLHYNACPTCGE